MFKVQIDGDSIFNHYNPTISSIHIKCVNKIKTQIMRRGIESIISSQELTKKYQTVNNMS